MFTSLHDLILLAENGNVDNPFDHTSPDIGPLGPIFSNKLYAMLGVVWGLAVIYSAIRLIMGIIKFLGAKRIAHNADALEEASKSILYPFIGICFLGGVGIVFAAAIGMFN